MTRRLVAVLIAAVATACSDTGQVTSPPDELHIASLSPAMTRILVDVGLGDHLVGRTGFCLGVDAVPVVGNLHELDAEAMVRVRPTHVFVQRASVDVDPLLRDLADAHGWDVVAGPLVDFSDVRRFLEAIPEVTGRDGEVAHRCRSRIDAVDEALRPRGALDMRVLLVSGGPEPLAWGAGTYLGQLLAAAGGQNLVEGRVWRTLSLEDVARLDADLILLVGIDEEPPHWAHDRVERLAFEGLEFPGPHLVTVTDRLREMIQQVAGSR